MARITSLPWTDQELVLLNKMKSVPASRVSQVIGTLYQKSKPGFPTNRSSSAIRNKRTALVETGEIVLPEPETFHTTLSTVQEIQSKHYSGKILGHENVTQDPSKQIKILSMSDIHFPFARVDALEKIIAEHSDADICVLNGDIVEGYCYSSYEKSRAVFATEEYRCLFSFVKTLLDVFPKIHLVEGNHEDRLARYLQKQGIGTAQSSLLGTSIMQRIANGEEIDEHGNVVAINDDFKTHVSFRSSEQWWTQIGKTIFIHPSNRINSDPGFTVSRWDKVFKGRFPHDSYDAMVCGHTHQIYKGVIGGHLLIEQGCLAGFMDYEWNRREPSVGMKAMNGYAVIYQDQQGNTDFNRSNVHYLGYVNKPDTIEE